MLAEVKVVVLKKQARSYAIKYYEVRGALSCGAQINPMTPSVNEWRLKFNETMDKLAELDPACQKSRL